VLIVIYILVSLYSQVMFVSIFNGLIFLCLEGTSPISLGCVRSWYGFYVEEPTAMLCHWIENPL